MTSTSLRESVASVVADPERIAAVRRLLLLGTPPIEVFDPLARLAARALRCPVALVTMVDADRQYLTGTFGLPGAHASGRETSLAGSVCQYVIGFGSPLLVCDTRSEHWLDDNRAVTALGVRAYAGMPLVTGAGHAVGVLSVMDVAPREWADDDVSTLAELAAIAMREVRLHRLERQVARQRRVLPR
jgi:GAF domain-containing protein